MIYPEFVSLVESGMTEYVVMAKSRRSVSRLLVKSLLTNENNCITRSSYLRSSRPFNKKSYLIIKIDS